MKIYVIIWITKFDSLYSMEPIGCYKDMEDALSNVAKLEKVWKKLGNDEYEEAAFDIIDFDLNEKPYLLEYFMKMKDKARDTADDQLRKLIKQGLVEQLIGEDGHFYYELTEMGKKVAKKHAKFPKQVKDWKKFFGKE